MALIYGVEMLIRCITGSYQIIHILRQKIHFFVLYLFARLIFIVYLCTVFRIENNLITIIKVIYINYHGYLYS